MLRETETVELKRSTAELREAVVSLVAMLNKRGRGTVYFGISDDGKPVGQMIGRRTVKDVTQTFVDNIEPRVFPDIEIRQINGAECIVVEAEGKHGPYFAYGRAYIRVGESDKALSAHELEARILRKNRVVWDHEHSQKTLAEVNEQAVESFMHKAKTAKRITFEFANVRTSLKKLKLIDGAHLTQAAEVLFCDENSLEVQAAIFAGTDKLTFLDMKQFEGTLFSVREQAEMYVKEHMRWRADLSESRRKEIPEIPIRALSEAIGNSLCHRDYANHKGNEIAIFKDRIEIYNPGFFPEGVAPEDYFTGEEHSILRNPLIAEAMFRSKDIERWGSGIKRIHEECANAGIDVDFKRLKTGFVVVFHRPVWETDEGGQTGGQTGGQRIRRTLSDKQKRVIDVIKQNSRISRKELAATLEINVSAVQKHVDRLKASGVLRRVGPDFGGRWEVVE